MTTIPPTPMPMIRGGMQPAPLPWLTALLKPRVKDFVDVSTRILHPLLEIAHDATHTTRSSNGEIDAHNRCRARSKQEFVEAVYYGTLPTETKRQLLGIPFDDFFNLCVRELTYLEHSHRCVQKERAEGLGFVLGCATHPDADVDGTLAPELWKYYEWITWWPPFEPTPGHSGPTSDEQYLILRDDPSDAFPGMTCFLDDNIPFPDYHGESTAESIQHMIKHFLWLAMNAVDIHLVEQRFKSTGQRTRQDIMTLAAQGQNLLAWYSMLVLRDPFSSIPMRVRNDLAHANINENVEFLLGYSIPAVAMNGVPGEVLHQVIYLLFLNAALDKVDELDADLDGTIRANMEQLHLQDSPDGTDSDTVPVWTRPVGMADVATVELEAYILRDFENGPATDVPVEPTGPRVDPDMVSDAASKPVGTERCPICLDDYTDDGDECVQLKACAHLLHRKCLDELVNGLYPGMPEIRCPICRKALCGARDYNAVLDNEVVSDDAS